MTSRVDKLTQFVFVVFFFAGCRWSAKLCTDRHNFICQHRMSYVNEKNRQKVYTKWNETYPNQLANEVEVYVSTNGNSNRR